MSRIGRAPITVPAGVTVTLGDANHVTVKGPKGTLEQNLHGSMQISMEGDVITVTRPSEEKEHKSLHGPVSYTHLDVYKRQLVPLSTTSSSIQGAALSLFAALATQHSSWRRKTVWRWSVCQAASFVSSA